VYQLSWQQLQLHTDSKSQQGVLRFRMLPDHNVGSCAGNRLGRGFLARMEPLPPLCARLRGAETLHSGVLWLSDTVAVGECMVSVLGAVEAHSVCSAAAVSVQTRWSS
jgi:hypothetical protein